METFQETSISERSCIYMDLVFQHCYVKPVKIHGIGVLNISDNDALGLQIMPHMPAVFIDTVVFAVAGV